MRTRWDFCQAWVQLVSPLLTVWPWAHFLSLKLMCVERGTEKIKEQKKIKEKEVGGSHPILCEGIFGDFLSFIDWCVLESLLTEACKHLSGILQSVFKAALRKFSFWSPFRVTDLLSSQLLVFKARLSERCPDNSYSHPKTFWESVNRARLAFPSWPSPLARRKNTESLGLVLVLPYCLSRASHS